MIRAFFYPHGGGKVTGISDVPDEAVANMAAESRGEAWVAGGTDVDTSKMWEVYGEHLQLYVPPPDTLPEAKAKKLAALAKFRWERSVVDLTIDGIALDGMKNSAVGLRDLASEATAAGLDTINFKTRAGYETVTPQQLLDVAVQLTLYVQACRDNERVHHEAIDQLQEPAGVESYDITTGWPSTIF